jgi:hypothetical protein
VDQAVSAQESAQYTGDVIRQLGRSMSFSLAEGSMFSKLLGVAGGASSMAGARLVSSPLPGPVLSRLEGTPALRAAHPALSLMTQEENFDDTAADVESLLKDRLMTAANVETASPTEVTYLLKGDPTCRPLPSKILEGAADVVDPECAADLQKLSVRVVVRGDGDGYRFKILLGPALYELATFVVHSDLLGWEADLFQAWQAGDFANMALGGQGEVMPFGRLQGRVKLAVQKLGPAKVSVSYGVLEAMDIQGKTDEPFAFSMAKSDPVLALTADGPAEQLTIKLGVPRTDVRAPWDPKSTGARNTDLHVALGGLFGETTISEGTEEVTFKGIGLAPSFAEVRFAHIVDVAFNPQSGNKMDLTVKSLAGGGSRFEISPRFDLSVGMKLKAVQADFAETPPAAFLDQTYSVVVAGGAPGVIEVTDAGFKLVAGSLTLATSADPAATVTVPAGQCLVDVEAPADTAHPLLGAVTAGSCQ